MSFKVNIFREAAFSHVHCELDKLNRILRKKTFPGLRRTCRAVADFLEQEIDAVDDEYDLKALRTMLLAISDFLNLAMRACADEGDGWARPLIRECYRACGINPDKHTILILHGYDNESYWVIPNLLGILRRQLNTTGDTNQPRFWNDILPIDVFSIPAEAKYDVSSIALIGHEVGHVYWAATENRNFLEEIIAARFKSEFVGEDLFQISDNREREAQLASKLEEYLCDETGRFLLGPAFDFALTKLLEAVPDNMLKSHPGSVHRIETSLKCLPSYKEMPSTDLNSAQYLEFRELIGCLDNLVACLEALRPPSPKDYKLKPEESLIEELLLDIENHKKSSPSVKRFNINLFNMWSQVRPELDAFRPPFEAVSKQAPVPITPREAIIAMTLYYYSGIYIHHNEYYQTSAKSETFKHDFLRRTLIKQLRYAISLYDFVAQTNQRFCSEDFFSEDWDHKLWEMRDRMVGGRKTALVVVPSTHPKSQYGPNSIDLRLGSSFLINRLTNFAHIDKSLLSGSEPKSDLMRFYEELYIPVGGEFILHPHQFVLAGTMEYICLPFDYYGLVLGRSSWGRLGLNIATATTVQAGFRGCLTLELRNLGETPLTLNVGIRIAQLALIQVPGESSRAGYFAAGNKYVGPTSAEVSKLSNDPDWDVLNLRES